MLNGAVRPDWHGPWPRLWIGGELALQVTTSWESHYALKKRRASMDLDMYLNYLLVSDSSAGGQRSCFTIN